MFRKIRCNRKSKKVFELITVFFPLNLAWKALASLLSIFSPLFSFLRFNLLINQYLKVPQPNSDEKAEKPKRMSQKHLKVNRSRGSWCLARIRFKLSRPLNAKSDSRQHLGRHGRRFYRRIRSACSF
jgi:hypothetical protein